MKEEQEQHTFVFNNGSSNKQTKTHKKSMKNNIYYSSKKSLFLSLIAIH